MKRQVNKTENSIGNVNKECSKFLPTDQEEMGTGCELGAVSPESGHNPSQTCKKGAGIINSQLHPDPRRLWDI